MPSDRQSAEVGHTDARAGEIGIPVDAVCTGCKADGKRHIRIKRASLDELGVDDLEDAGGRSFRHVCHRCRSVEFWNVQNVLDGLLSDGGTGQ